MTIDKTKQYQPPKESPEAKAALYVHLAESGQITELPLMNYEEALKWFQERMKAEHPQLEGDLGYDPIKLKALKRKDEEKGKLALERIKKGLLKEVAISAKYGFDVKKHWEEMLAFSDKEKQENNLLDSLKENPNLKKPKTDYGALTVKALKRMK